MRTRISICSVLVMLAMIIASKNVLLEYSCDKKCDLLEIVENGGEEKESEREEVKEEVEFIAHTLAELSIDDEPKKATVLLIEVIKNSRHSEVLTPPPDLMLV